MGQPLLLLTLVVMSPATIKQAMALNPWSNQYTGPGFRAKACFMVAGDITTSVNKGRWLGSGCGLVGRAVASDTRGPWFESSQWQNVCWTIVYLFTIKCIENTKINKKRPGMAHFFKKQCQVGQWAVFLFRCLWVISLMFRSFWSSRRDKVDHV